MRAIIYHQHDDIRLEGVPIPIIGPGELLVRVAGCGLCGSDLLKIQQRAAPPVKLGHELTGVVVERGAGVEAFAPEQRVVVAHHVPCGECHYCTHGNVSMCATFKVSNLDPCGFAEYVRVPRTQVEQVTLALPDALSDEAGAFTEPLACVVRAVRRSALQAGDLAVVVGLGTVGLLMAQAFRAAGASVLGLDMLPERLAFAGEYGVSAVSATEPDLLEHVRALSDGRGADLAMLAVGGDAAFQQALDLVRAGGNIHLFAATPGALAQLDLDALYHRELTVQTTYSSSPDDLRAALDLLAAGRVRVDGLYSHRLPLERFAEGVALFASRQARKVYFAIADQVTSPHG
jgi:L-iditol 2-dehydrogenase